MAKGFKFSIATRATLWLSFLSVFQWQQVFSHLLTFNKNYSIVWISLSKINYVAATFTELKHICLKMLTDFQHSFCFAIFSSEVSLFLKMKTYFVDIVFSCTNYSLTWRDIMASSLAHTLSSSILLPLAGSLIYLNVTVSLAASKEFVSSFFESHQGGREN